MVLSNTIFIAGISKKTSISSVISKFSCYFNENNKNEMLVAIYPEKGYGFITLDSSNSVSKAINDSKSKKGITIDNYRLRLEISKKPVKISQNEQCRKKIFTMKKHKLIFKNKIEGQFTKNKFSEYDTDDEEEIILLRPSCK